MNEIYDFNKQLLDKYVLEPFFNNEKYLYLHPFPTGTGKTTNVSKIIDEILKYKEKKIIYLINTKKTRDEVELNLKNVLKEKFDEVINLKSEMDYIIENKNIIINKLLYIKYDKKEKFIKFLENVHMYDNEYRQEKINFYLSDIKKIYKNKQMALRKNEIKFLFPTIDLNKRVIITTIQKFISSCTDFPYNYYLYDRYKDSLIIIDEFDTQKNVVLNKFVQESVKGAIDKIDFVREIYEKLNNKSNLIEKFDELLEDKIHKELLLKIEKFYYKYNLKYKMYLEKEQKRSFFIPTKDISFLDKKIIYSLSKDKNYIKEIDKKIKLNKNEFNFYEIYKEANILFLEYKDIVISYIQQSIKEKLEKFSDKYVDIFNEELNFYFKEIFVKDNVESGFIKKLKQSIEMSRFGRNVTRFFQGDNINLKFHKQPFVMMVVHSDNDSHNMCNVQEYSIQTTPEMFLATLANKFLVVGLSATALIPTKIENFSLDILGDKLRLPTKNEMKSIKTLYKNKLKNKTFKFRVITSKYGIKENLQELVSKKYIDKLLYYYGDMNEYEFKKIVNFCQVYLFFYEKKIESFLYLTTFNFKEERLLKALKLLLIIFTSKRKRKENKKLNLFLDKLKETDDIVSFINNLELKNLKEIFDIVYTDAKNKLTQNDIENYIQKNKKIFLLSNYAYMSKAQNLQYKNKDFEGIFLDEKTNILLSSINDIKEKKDEKLLKAFYQGHILSFYHQISYFEMFEYFKKLIQNRASLYFYKQTDDYDFVMEILFIQAIGRIVRTSTKQKHFILFDESFLNIIPQFDREDETLPIIDEMIDYVNNYIKDRDYKKINEINQASNEVNKHIKTILSSFKTDKPMIKEWKEIRDFLLKHPTIKPHEKFKFLYFENDNYEYYYKREDEVRIKDYRKTKTPNYSNVSKKDVKIDALFSIKELDSLKEYISNDFSKPLSMLPIVYTNLYKGALGETIGKTLFEYFGIKLQDIDITYETFDFMIKENIYVDFKYYNSITNLNFVNIDELIEKTFSKLPENSLVFIVNIFKDKELKDFKSKISEYQKENKRVILVPSLIEFKKGKYKINYNKIQYIKDKYESYNK